MNSNALYKVKRVSLKHFYNGDLEPGTLDNVLIWKTMLLYLLYLRLINNNILVRTNNLCGPTTDSDLVFIPKLQIDKTYNQVQTSRSL